MPNFSVLESLAKYQNVSAHKTRRVINQIRGKSVEEALLILEFLSCRSSKIIKCLLNSATANAKTKYSIEKKMLKIERIFANEGPKLKRARSRAKGKSCEILKPTCHIVIAIIQIY